MDYGLGQGVGIGGPGAYRDYEWFWLSKKNMRVQAGELGQSGWAAQAHQVTAALQSPQDLL